MLLKGLKTRALSRNWVVVLVRQAIHRLAESISGLFKSLKLPYLVLILLCVSNFQLHEGFAGNLVLH
jgi:hypothetical protein